MLCILMCAERTYTLYESYVVMLYVPFEWSVVLYDAVCYVIQYRYAIAHTAFALSDVHRRDDDG